MVEEAPEKLFTAFEKTGVFALKQQNWEIKVDIFSSAIENNRSNKYCVLFECLGYETHCIKSKTVQFDQVKPIPRVCLELFSVN